MLLYIWLSGLILGIGALIFFKTKFKNVEEDRPNELPQSPQLPIWFGIVYVIIYLIPWLGLILGVCIWIFLGFLLWTMYCSNDYETSLIYQEGWFFRLIKKISVTLNKTF